jgi:two-component system chemotaxis response regulator CheY
MTKTALTVDDSRTMREMVSFTLKGIGFAVKEAEDGVQAMKLINVDKFDLIITDLNMPNMDGLQLIKEIRARAATKFVPILMLTTESDDSKKSEGKNSGATGWLVKPFNPEKLIQVVQKVCP